MWRKKKVFCAVALKFHPPLVITPEAMHLFFLAGSTPGWCVLSRRVTSIQFILKSTLTRWDTVATKWSEKIVPEICESWKKKCGGDGIACQLKSLLSTKSYLGDIFKNRVNTKGCVFPQCVRSGDTNKIRKSQVSKVNTRSAFYLCKSLPPLRTVRAQRGNVMLKQNRKQSSFIRSQQLSAHCSTINVRLSLDALLHRHSIQNKMG